MRYLPTLRTLRTLPYFYMYILDKWTGDDDSPIYWKYIIISYSREARISNQGCLIKKKKSKSKDYLYLSVNKRAKRKRSACNIVLLWKYN